MSTDNSKLEVDGEHYIFQDKLLEGLVGNWKVTGRIAGQRFEQYCDADWVLNHQFLRVHFIDSAARNRGNMETPSNAEYEALVFIGYDNMSERYVVHWLDVFGGRFSETIGFGRLNNENSIKFVFEGPDGPLHNTVSRNSSNGTWSIIIEQKDGQGRWTTFAVETLHRVNWTLPITSTT